MSSTLRFHCIGVLVGLLSGPAAAELDAVERRLVDHVRVRSEAALALLEETVSVNSGTMNFQGVREVGRIFAAELETLGFSTEWIDGTPFGRAGHLIASRSGSGPHALLIGHLDTVFETDSPFQSFERIDPFTARGPGTTDMKGGNIVMLEALAALAAEGVLDALEVTVVLTGDEEKSGRPLALARRHLVDAGRAADFALGFEDGDGDPATAVVARRGSLSWRLDVRGVSSHSSQVFTERVGAGAAYEASRFLSEVYRRLSADADPRFRDLTVNPGLVLAGTQVELDAAQARGTAFGKDNVVAEHAVVTGDLRALSPQQVAAAQETMRAIASDNLPRTSAELTFLDGYPPMASTEGNHRLLAILDEVSRDLDLGPVTAVDPRAAGAADVSFVAEHVGMALDGLGLMGDGGHTVDETADLRTLVSQAQRAAVLLYRICRDRIAD